MSGTGGGGGHGGLTGRFNNVNDKYEHLVAEIARLAAAMEKFEFPKSDQQGSPGYKLWEPFVEYDGGTTDGSGNLTVKTKIMSRGWEGYVHRISVTVQGASNAATVANYRGGVGDANLFDFASAMFGGSPSRLVGGYVDGIYFAGEECHIVIAGAVAAQGTVVRIEGRRRQVQAGQEAH